MGKPSLLANGTLLRGGAYRIDRALSSGGFGNTYVITNMNFNQTFALKEFFMKDINLRKGNMVTVSIAANQKSFNAQREKFKKEAQRLWNFKSEHIVQVHDLFEENGTVYYVMDFIDGESLSARLRTLRRCMTTDELLPVLLQALDALEAVHAQQIWHLDIKPGNIMLDKQGKLYLIDFGASKQLHTPDGQSVATSAVTAYTPGFAPLEQTDRNVKLFGPWTDLYSLGATAYKMLVGKTPPTPSEIISNGGRLTFPERVPSSMRELITWMMKPAYKERPQSAAEVRLFIERMQAGEETEVMADVTDAALADSHFELSSQSATTKPRAFDAAHLWLERMADYRERFRGWMMKRPEKFSHYLMLVLGLVSLVGIIVLLSYLFRRQTVVDEDQIPPTEVVSHISWEHDGQDVDYEGHLDPYGVPHGNGTARYPNGDTYKGPFDHGYRQGPAAVYHFSDGRVYEGSMNGDHFDIGRLTHPDGSYFYGQFGRDNKPFEGVWEDAEGHEFNSLGDAHKYRKQLHPHGPEDDELPPPPPPDPVSRQRPDVPADGR